MMLAHAFAFSEQEGNQLSCSALLHNQQKSIASLPEMTSDQAN